MSKTKYSVIRVTKNYATVVVAGGGQLYINHEGLGIPDGPFWNITTVDNEHNRISESSKNDKEIDIPLAIGLSKCETLDAIKEWVERKRKETKQAKA